MKAGIILGMCLLISCVNIPVIYNDTGDLSVKQSSEEVQRQPSFFTDIDIQPGGVLLAAGSADNTILIYNLETMKIEEKRSAHQEAVSDIEWSFDGRLLVSCDERGGVNVWSPEREYALSSFTVENCFMSAVHWNRKGNKVYTVSKDLYTGDSHVILWNTITGSVLRVFVLKQNIMDIDVNPVNGDIALATEDGQIFILSFTLKKSAILMDTLFPVLDVEFTSNGESLLAYSEDKNLFIYDTENWDILYTNIINEEEDSLLSIIYLNEQQMTISFCLEIEDGYNVVETYNLFTGDVSFKVTEDPVSTLTFQNGYLIVGTMATVNNKVRGILKIYDAAEDHLMQVFYN